MKNDYGLLWWTLVAAVMLLVMSFAITFAHAHKWYDRFCCNNQDCKPLSYTPKPLPNGGYRLRDGSVYKRTMVRPSGDHQWHACKPFGRPRCLYRPAGDM